MLSKIRKVKGYTQRALALELGVSQQAVSNWERGVCEPSLDILKTISNILSCSIDDLIKEEIIK